MHTYIHTYIIHTYMYKIYYGHTGMKKNDQLGKKFIFFSTLRTIQVTYCAFPIMDKGIMGWLIIIRGYVIASYREGNSWPICTYMYVRTYVQYST